MGCAHNVSSPSMGDVARSAGVGGGAIVEGPPQEAISPGLRDHPLSHRAARDDSSPIEGELGEAH